MARPSKPTAVLELSGAFRHDPSRAAARAHEPQPTGPLGDPPPCFTDLQRAIWIELAGMCPPGVLGNMDRWLVEITCRLMAQLRAADDENSSVRPLSSSQYSLILTCLGRMGLTPSDRSKVVVPSSPAEEDDPFAKLASDVAAAKSN